VKLARKLADRFGAELVRVQHHVAHAMSVMAEHGLEKAVAITIDGYGYGDDGNAWGGEVFSIEGGKYERVYHLKYVSYAGGDLNAVKPDRMLALFLSELMPWEEVRGYVSLPEEELKIIEEQKRRSNLLTSSAGRFLDAVSAFLGVSHERTYEGEPAIMLEARARGGKVLDLELPVTNVEIDTLKAFEWLLENRDKRAEDLALTVQYALGRALIGAALKLNPEVVVVSGGAAVNEYILRGILDGSQGVRVLTNSLVPSGDGGIALGQAYYLAMSSDARG
jgi:hydrogenase maturation protein HypF